MTTTVTKFEMERLLTSLEFARTAYDHAIEHDSRMHETGRHFQRETGDKKKLLARAVADLNEADPVAVPEDLRVLLRDPQAFLEGRPTPAPYAHSSDPHPEVVARHVDEVRRRKEEYDGLRRNAQYGQAGLRDDVKRHLLVSLRWLEQYAPHAVPKALKPLLQDRDNPVPSLDE